MGSSTYSYSDRATRATSAGYGTKSADEIFEQNRKRKIHDSMNPKNAKLREARDSAAHPNTVPIILSLDVTGSMGKIPHNLVKEGLPHMMQGIIDDGTPDPALLFVAVGDSTVDDVPLQVGQFESGDQELDQWLTRTYIEGGGGGNEGESYLLAWYFAAYHTVTDAWEKRGQKGFLFTIGDEPCLEGVSNKELERIMGEKYETGAMADVLLADAQKTYDVYHLHILQGQRGKDSLAGWEQRLGQRCIPVNNYEDVAKIITKIVNNELKTPQRYNKNQITGNKFMALPK